MALAVIVDLEVNWNKLILFVFLLGAPLQVAGQAITGNIIDGFDRKFLPDVWVVNQTRGDSSLTNERGYFRVSGTRGDTLFIHRNHFIATTYVVGQDTHILTAIYMDARTLPPFDLYAEKITIPFNVGNVSSMRGLSDRPAGPGKIYSGMSDNPGLMPALTLDGPISYFMKSERQKRQYAKKLAFLNSQSGYLEFIQSDSVKSAFIQEFGLKEAELDSLIIQFNLFHLEHQFVNMSKERVGNLFYDFLQNRIYRREEE